MFKKTPSTKDSLEINDAIIEVMALAGSEAEKNRVLARTQLAEHLPAVHADRVQLQQVVLNLVMNAIEAMSGSSEDRRELMISTVRADRDGVLVAVRDTGPGFTPGSADR
jgi:C4-dicarboxylate-specific signal transduction histidine kinase